MYLHLSYHLADEFQDDDNLKLGSLSSVPISMILSDCQHDVFFKNCYSESMLSRSSRCESQSFLGVLSNDNVSLASATGFFPSSTSTCKLSWRIYDQDVFSRIVTIFERLLYSSSVSSLLYPNIQDISIFGSDFLASQAMFHVFNFECISFQNLKKIYRTHHSLLQISLKIYDITHIISASESVQCSSTNFSRIDERTLVLLKSLQPATEITDINIHNESMISFKLDSTKLSTGLKIITAQADSQVFLSHLQIARLDPEYAHENVLQVFHQQLCLNITMNEHLTAKKLIDIIVSHKQNAGNPFMDENLLLNQRHVFSDIEAVVSSSASCTNEGAAPFSIYLFQLLSIIYSLGTSQRLYSNCYSLKKQNNACHQCCFQKCTQTGYLPCRSPDQTLGSLPSRCKAWCMSLCDSES